jgi:hypothetical protein
VLGETLAPTYTPFGGSGTEIIPSIVILYSLGRSAPSGRALTVFDSEVLEAEDIHSALQSPYSPFDSVSRYQALWRLATLPGVVDA